MKWLVSRSLNQLVLFTALGIFTLLLAEGFLLKQRYASLTAIGDHINYTKQCQNHFDQLVYLTRLQKAGEQETTGTNELVHAITRELQIIQTGGHLAGTATTIEKLPSFARASHDELKLRWERFLQQRHSFLEQTNEETSSFTQAASVSIWFTNLIADLNRIQDDRETYMQWTVAFLLLTDAVILLGLVFGFRNNLIKPLHQLAANTVAHTHTRGLPPNELGFAAEKVNHVIEQLRDATDFVQSIGEGNLTKDYRELEPDYAPGRNQLADSLIAMQAKLRSLAEEEQKRTWANEGLAKFVDILRASGDNLQQLGDKIISALVKYTEANQGGLYVLHEEDTQNRYLELVSLFAFNTKKFQQQRIKPGEGLLGQTFLEKETTYMRVLPQEYTRITSGLGDANPSTLLIVPLKVDNRVYGMVELASFREFQPHEISFVEKLGETIASTLASVKAAHNNQKLLEESRMTTEAMRAQEEEMRQNMEELTATQEEMQRVMKEAQQKETYLSNLMNATTDAFVAIDKNYRVALRNNAPLFEQFVKSGIPYDVGYYVLELFKGEDLEYHKSIYDKVFAGQTLSVTKEYFGRPYSVNYKPLRAPGGEVLGAAIYAHDLTESLEMEKRIEALSAQSGTAVPSKSLENLEKTLKINLEALRITQDELRKKLS